MRKNSAASPLLLLLTVSCLALPVMAQVGHAIPPDQLTEEEQLARRVTPEVLVVQRATPAVVYIQTDTQRMVQHYWFGVRPQKGKSSGSGVVLSSDGFVVTNYHVVKDAKEIRISFEKSIDEEVYYADMLSFVAEEDLALLKIRNPEGRQFGTVEMGTSSDLMIGERVLAIGNPYGHTHTVSIGIISGLHRGVKIADAQSNLRFDFDDLIQTDASINPGNSGGPLLNINGQLIGINNAVNNAAENIGFAIPIDRVKEVLQQQLISPDRYHAWMGFEINDEDKVVVQSVMPGSPAFTAGLRTGDQILGFGEDTIETLEEYRMVRLAMRPGEISDLRVQRQNKTLMVPIQAWDKSEGLIYERLGVRVQLVALGRGVGSMLRISEILEGGAAEQIGLRVGDLIAAMRPKVRGLSQAYTFPNRNALAQFIDRLDSGVELEIEIRRGPDLYQGTVVLD